MKIFDQPPFINYPLICNFFAESEKRVGRPTSILIISRTSQPRLPSHISLASFGRAEYSAMVHALTLIAANAKVKTESRSFRAPQTHHPVLAESPRTGDRADPPSLPARLNIILAPVAVHARRRGRPRADWRAPAQPHGAQRWLYPPAPTSPAGRRGGWEGGGVPLQPNIEVAGRGYRTIWCGPCVPMTPRSPSSPESPDWPHLWPQAPGPRQGLWFRRCPRAVLGGFNPPGVAGSAYEARSQGCPGGQRCGAGPGGE